RADTRRDSPAGRHALRPRRGGRLLPHGLRSASGPCTPLAPRILFVDPTAAGFSNGRVARRECTDGERSERRIYGGSGGGIPARFGARWSAREPGASRAGGRLGGGAAAGGARDDARGRHAHLRERRRAPGGGATAPTAG